MAVAVVVQEATSMMFKVAISLSALVSVLQAAMAVTVAPFL